MVAERLSSETPSDETPRGPDLRLPFLVSPEGQTLDGLNSEPAGKKEKRKRRRKKKSQSPASGDTIAATPAASWQEKAAQWNPLGGTVEMWNRTENDDVSQPTAEAYEPVGLQTESVPAVPPPLLLDPNRMPYEQPDEPERVAAAPSRSDETFPSVAVFKRYEQAHETPERRPLPSVVRVAAGAAIERVARTPESVTGARSERQLGKRELMKVAKDIKIDGVRLKEVYDAKRIDEEGLRAIVNSYLRGGDVKQQLTRELVIKESSFERDPRIRHMRVTGEQARRGRDGHADDEAAGESRASLLATSTQKTAKLARKTMARGAKVVQQDLIDNSNTVDWISVTAVVVLYSIILILLLN